MRTIVYVDGFNLYYGCLKRTPYRWLNLDALCHALLPKSQILQINYYTARISARANDPGQPVRQEMYLRALNTLPTIRIFEGHYLENPTFLPLAAPVGTTRAQRPAGPIKPPYTMAWVMKSEEKGSDVNLGAHLVLDACRDRYDVAAVITNDSDLAEPLRIVRQEFQKGVAILNPYQNASRELGQYATFTKSIRAHFLAASQFPPTLTDSHGTFHKPASW